jgi:ribose transport system permease protein
MTEPESKSRPSVDSEPVAETAAKDGDAQQVDVDSLSSSSFLRRIGGRQTVGSRRNSPLERYAGVGLLVVMFAFFSFALPHEFFTYDNLIGVVSNEAIAGIMALALLLPLAAGVFDISIGGMMTLAMVLVTWLFQVTSGSMPIPAAIAITLLVGVVAGCFNGTIVIRGRVDPFIATIASSSVMLGISEAIANGTTIYESIPHGFTDLGRAHVGKVPITVFYVAAVALLLWYILDRTPFGRKVYATGAGREASRLAGVRTNRVIFLSFVASATLASLAGIINAAQLGTAPPNVGAGFLLPAYAAAFFGATMIKPGRFNVVGLIVALFILAIGINGLQLFGLAFWIVDLYQGVVLIVAVLLARATATPGS